MPARIIIPAVLFLCIAVTAADAQPLRLGSTREEVMRIVYREGAHADTLRPDSHLIRQIRMYPDTGYKLRYNEVVRVAPVKLFGMDGYGAFVFDTSGRLASYNWIRGEMKGYIIGPGWENAFTWTSDVSHDTYLAVRDSITRSHPKPSWGEKPQHRQAATFWNTESDWLHLVWEDGALILNHGPSRRASR